MGKPTVNLVLQTVLVAVMCKQLYWNWISTFTSGIHLEERRAADGKALKQQAVPQQVHLFSLCAFYLILGSGSCFLLLGYSDTFYTIDLVILSFEGRLKDLLYELEYLILECSLKNLFL